MNQKIKGVKPMDGKKVLALMMGAIVVASGMSQMAVQVYAHDEESRDSSYSYADSIDISILDEEKSSGSPEPMEDDLDAEELKKLTSFESERAKELIECKSLKAELSNLYVSENKLVFKPEADQEAKLVCLDEEREFNGNIVVPGRVIINGEFYSVTSIGDRAFCYCEKLKSVTLSNNITRIDNGAFNHCINLQLKALPKGITKIGAEAFEFCVRLNLSALPENLLVIDNGAFAHCGNLRLEELPNSLEKIGIRAFANTGIITLTIPASVIELGNSAFNTNSIEKINLEQGSILKSDDIERAYGRQLERIQRKEVFCQEYLRIMREKIIDPVELNAEVAEDVCSICHCKFNEVKGKVGRLPCGHCMHLECFDDQVRENLRKHSIFKCPVCRKEYK